jgi:hypothetical protein
VSWTVQAPDQDFVDRPAAAKIACAMIYCVVPRSLADELYPRLLDYYKDEDNVTVIVDRRRFDRRARGRTAGAPDPEAAQRRVVRDRRRARVAGDMPPLARLS